MSKTVWMINHHALTPDMSGGTRHYDFAKELVKRGYKITIIAASFHYSKFQEMKGYGKTQNYLQENIDGVDFIWFKTPPYKGNGIGRVKNMLSFMFSVINIIPKLNLNKPDTIIGSSVHLFAVYAAYLLSLKYQAKFIMEVRDLWPQTLLDMGFSKWHPFIIVLGLLEKFLYKKADIVLTNLPYAYRYLEKFIVKEKVVWISNGVDTHNIKYYKPIKKEKLTIMYAGALGIANGIDILVEAAIKLEKYKNIEFTIIGNGTEKGKLENKIKTLALRNVYLLDSVPKTNMSSLLSQADVLFFNLKDSVVFKYGISSNKLFDYMAAGRIIIFSANSPNNPVKNANGGISIPSESLGELVESIKSINVLSYEEKLRFGVNNTKYVKKNYSISVLADKLEEII